MSVDSARQNRCSGSTTVGWIAASDERRFVALVQPCVIVNVMQALGHRLRGKPIQDSFVAVDNGKLRGASASPSGKPLPTWLAPSRGALRRQGRLDLLVVKGIAHAPSKRSVSWERDMRKELARASGKSDMKHDV